MSSRIDKADAQEWLESLQQVGEGWYRQVALAVRANAHKALGMERREFAQAIGQKMIDPRDAIIELHREGHTPETIADVLGVSPDRTVKRILAEEGLIEWQPNVARKALESGYDAPQDVADVPREAEEDVADALRNELEKLALQVKGERAKAKRDREEAAKKLKTLRTDLTNLKRQAKKDELLSLTDAERDRARKEAEAWAAEEGRKILVGLAHLTVAGIVSNLEDARDELRLLIEQDAITIKALKQIEKALTAFENEMEVATMKTEEE